MAQITIDYGNVGGGNKGISGEFTISSSSLTHIDCGFKPTSVFLLTYDTSNGGAVWIKYDVSNSKLTMSYGTTAETDITSVANQYFPITNDGFSFMGFASSYNGKKAYYMATKE